MTTLIDCKKDLDALRDDCDKLVECLQEASQAENMEDFLAGCVCADEKTIILSADLFDLISKVNRAVPPAGLVKKEAPKEIEVAEAIKIEYPGSAIIGDIVVDSVKVEYPLKSEIIETLPVEAKVEVVAVEPPKEETVKEESAKVEPTKEETTSETV